MEIGNEKTQGFLTYKREDLGHRPVDERVGDFKAVELLPDEGFARRQAARCMECGTPFCHGEGCPLDTLVPEINALVFCGRWREALQRLLATHPFPEFTARVCPALCEASCVLGIHDQPVSIRAIELAVIERGFREGWMIPQPPVCRRDKNVAVIGSGPAGLAAAQVLNRAGFAVVVYESARKLGGILRYGIPEYKLEKSIVDRRLQLMEAEGIVFESGVEAGADLSLRFLLDRFDALVIAGGSRQPRDLDVPGRDCRGIHMAMDYLTQQNRALDGALMPPELRLSAKNKTVAVIGGGDTGADCLGTALRQGARHVEQLEIMPEPPHERAPETPWPMWPHQLRVASSHQEGGVRHWSVSTTAFDGKDGHVVGLRGEQVAWTSPKPGACPVPSPVPGSGFAMPCDLVLLALGFCGPVRNRLYDDLDLKRSANGAVQRDANGMTSRPGVFVAGDMASGASLVVRALADGKAVARSVVRYLDTPHRVEKVL